MKGTWHPNENLTLHYNLVGDGSEDDPVRVDIERFDLQPPTREELRKYMQEIFEDEQEKKADLVGRVGRWLR